MLSSNEALEELSENIYIYKLFQMIKMAYF